MGILKWLVPFLANRKLLVEERRSGAFQRCVTQWRNAGNDAAKHARNIGISATIFDASSVKFVQTTLNIFTLISMKAS